MIHRPFRTRRLFLRRASPAKHRIRRVIATTAAFIILATVLTTLLCAPAWAAGSNMPWEQPLNQILQSVEGPVAKIMAVIIIIVTGLTLAFGIPPAAFAG